MGFRAVISSAPKAEVTGSHTVGRATKPLAKMITFSVPFRQQHSVQLCSPEAPCTGTSGSLLDLEAKGPEVEYSIGIDLPGRKRNAAGCIALAHGQYAGVVTRIETQGAAAEAPPRRRRISKCRLPSLTSIKTDSAALPLEGIIEQRRMEAITPKDWRHASDLQACDAQRRRRACGIVFTHAKFGLRSAKLVASRSSRSLLDRITPTLGGVQRHDDHCLC